MAKVAFRHFDAWGKINQLHPSAIPPPPCFLPGIDVCPPGSGVEKRGSWHPRFRSLAQVCRRFRLEFFFFGMDQTGRCFTCTRRVLRLEAR